MTSLQEMRQAYQPKLPSVLEKLTQLQANEEPAGNPSVEISTVFPCISSMPLLTFAPTSGNIRHNTLKVGIVLSGGQAAGGHNVITGLFDALKELNPASQLYGFLNGPAGIIENKYIELKEQELAVYRNQGGFDLLGSGRTKIETPESFQAVLQNVNALDLDGLVIVGGDDSNTNAAFLAEYFFKNNCKTKVVGIPKTIDGDLKNEYVECSFGFDTACKTYSEFIGNVLRDALSQKKYYFFIKLMGRSASHVALECALQTHPNMTLIGEEIEAKKMTIAQITQSIADMICKRAEQKKDYGVVLIPEGIIEFIPECKVLIGELNTLLVSSDAEKALQHLTPPSKACFDALPQDVQKQLLLDRDPHGNVQVSKIESDRLFIETVKQELKKRGKEYQGKFSAQPLFCGYEGRSCLPTNFDAQYCYALGHVAALLIDQGRSGYMAVVQNLAGPVVNWQIAAVPLVLMMQMEKRKGKMKPVIRKALVELNGPIFTSFIHKREGWMLNDQYLFPGPIQFFGPESITDSVSFSINLSKR